MVRRLAVLTLVMALAVAWWLWPGGSVMPPVAADEGLTVHDVADNLVCQCGCGLTVAACGESMTCSVADEMRQEIQRQIDAGKSKGEILDYFASIYGEEVLAAPRKSGFSLVAWVMPFLALIAAAALVGWLVWVWSRRRPAPGPQEPLPAPEVDLSPYEQRVEEDLRSLQ